MLVLIFSLLLPQAFSASSKSTCTERELRGQDCRLNQGSYKIRLLTETVARDDGTWHTVDPMPLKEPGVVWEKVQFEVQNSLPLLQLWIWDSGKGEARVQSLRWFVTDARRGALKVLSDGVVRRRRLRPVEDVVVDPNAKPGAKKPETPQPSFLYDGWERHSVKVLKNGRLEWELGAERKMIDPGVAVKSAEKSDGQAKDHGKH